MFGIPKGGSAHLAMLVTVKENKARIGPMIIGVDRTATVQFVHQWRRNLPLFNEVGSGNRPVGILPHRVDCGQFLKGFPFRVRGLLPAPRKRKRCLARCERQKLVRQRSAGRREIHLGDVDNQINGTATAHSCLVVEPPVACDDDVVMLALRAERRAFGASPQTRNAPAHRGAECRGLGRQAQRFSSLIGHPNERRSSLKVFLTSSGEGQSEDSVELQHSSFLGGLGLGGGSSGVNPSAA